MKITIEFIPHLEQRYNTCGDWVFSESGDLSIKISDTGVNKWNAALAIHELVEAITCKADGITTEMVDQFDMSWTPFGSFEEPGEDPRAPYFAQHNEATMIEQQLFDFMSEGGEPEEWNEYEAKLEEFEKEYAAKNSK